MEKLRFIGLLLVFGISAAQNLPEPIQVFEKDGIKVKSYDFQALKPMLEFRDDVTYVVNFWATWCAPCVAELPHFEKLASEVDGNKVKFIFVSLDMKKQVETALISFLKRRGFKQAVVHLSDPDANAWIAQVDPMWSGAIPATLIYRQGQRKFYEQTFTYESLKKEVSSFNP